MAKSLLAELMLVSLVPRYIHQSTYCVSCVELRAPKRDPRVVMVWYEYLNHWSPNVAFSYH